MEATKAKRECVVLAQADPALVRRYGCKIFWVDIY
jgi:hypothetical protein